MENKNCTVAIDLGSNTVVVAVGSLSADGRLIVEDIVIKESRGVVKGEVKNVELAAQSVREAVKEIEGRLGITIDEACTGISGSHIKCVKHPYYVYVGGNDGEISETDVRRLNESMRNVQAPDGYKLLQILPQHYVVNEDEEVADPVGMFGKTLGSTFNLIIGDNNIVSRLEKAFQKVDIKQKELLINPLATAGAVTFPDEKELGVAVVDLGAGTSDITIYQDGIVRYVGVIPLGADTINRDIRSYGIMERYVEELKIKYGCAVPEMADADKLIKVPGRTPHDHKEISFRNLASIINARLLDIVDYIVEEIKASGYEGKLSAGIILTGGNALTKEIKALVEDRTGLDVRIALPDILLDDDSKEKVTDPRMSAAVGILAASLGSGKTTTVRPGKKTEKPAAEKPEIPFRKEETKTDRSQRPVETSAGKQADVSSERTDEDDYTERTRKKGIFQKLREKFEKTFDFDVLDDDSTI